MSHLLTTHWVWDEWHARRKYISKILIRGNFGKFIGQIVGY